MTQDNDIWGEYQVERVLAQIRTDRFSILTHTDAEILAREIARLREYQTKSREFAQEKVFRRKLPWYKRLAEILPIFWLTLELSRWITAIPFRPS